MKKFAKVFAMAAAVAAFGFGFTSCDDKDDSGSKEVFSIVFTKVVDKSNTYGDYYISEVINFEVEDEKREAAPEDDEDRMYMKFSKSNEPRGVAAPEKYGWECGSIISIENDPFEIPMFCGDYVSTGNVYTLDVNSVNTPSFTENGITENWAPLPSIPGLTGWKKITINNDSFALTISEDDPIAPFFDAFAGE